MNLPMQEPLETWVLSLGREDPLEEETATHSSIRAWEVPWTEEPGGLWSTGLQSRTWLSTQACTHAFISIHFASYSEGFWHTSKTGL